MSEQFDEAFWDERYRSKPTLWSGRPNPHLVAEAAALPPGAALDVGSGEGADALWLAERGWRVTALDISTVALERGAAAATAAGLADQVTWQQADLITWEPVARYDLISAQYFHLPSVVRGPLFRRLAAAVAPGGSLLIVAHHPSDLEVFPRPPLPDLFFTGEDIAALLDPAEWTVVTDVAAPRSATHPEGHEVTIHDVVFRARRV